VQLDPDTITRVWTSPAEPLGRRWVTARRLHVYSDNDVVVFVVRAANHRATILADLFGWVRGADS
jgi:hypothetical protein